MKIRFNSLQRFVRDEEGATAVEYGIIAGLMALMLVVIFGTDGVVATTLTELFESVSTAVLGGG
jgi:pilus assembly protein Flp/PilA